jgi:hypothetical protein
MPNYLLSHRHEPDECAVAFAAWRGFDSPLRRHKTVGTCAKGGHELWWTVEADSRRAALAQLPEFVAERTQVVEVREVPIP